MSRFYQTGTIINFDFGDVGTNTYRVSGPWIVVQEFDQDSSLANFRAASQSTNIDDFITWLSGQGYIVDVGYSWYLGNESLNPTIE